MDLHEDILNEQPWVQLEDILDNDGDEIIWDFCAEEKGWLKQLYDLFDKGEMTTMNIEKNMVNKIKFNSDELPNVIKSMLNDKWFRDKFCEDFSKLSNGEKLKFMDILPAEFMELI